MAYSTYSDIPASYSAAYDFICASIVSAGWVLHDTVSSTKKVYKSRGESDKYPYYNYISLEWNSSSRVYFEAYLFWDAGTDTGYCGHKGNGSSYREFALDNFQLGTKVIAAGGNKNVFWVNNLSIASGANGSKIMGYLYKPLLFDDVTTTLSSGATAGDAVTISVVSSAGLGIGTQIYIVDETNLARFVGPVITAIPNGTSITVDTLPYDISSGSYLMNWSPNFGFNYSSYYFCVQNKIDPGLSTGQEYTQTHTNSNLRLSRNVTIATAYTDPGPVNELDMLTPAIGYNQTPSYYIDDHQAVYGITEAENEVYYTVRAEASIHGIMNNFGHFENLQASGGTLSTLVKTGAGWTTDEWAGKFCITTAGTGLGQSRKIASNTSDTLTFTNDMHTSGDNTTVFYIVDVVYYSISANLVVKQGW